MLGQNLTWSYIPGLEHFDLVVWNEIRLPDVEFMNEEILKEDPQIENRARIWNDPCIPWDNMLPFLDFENFARWDSYFLHISQNFNISSSKMNTLAMWQKILDGKGWFNGKLSIMHERIKMGSRWAKLWKNERKSWLFWQISKPSIGYSLNIRTKLPL